MAQIIAEARLREDLDHITDNEIKTYIDDCDGILADTYFPKYASVTPTAGSAGNDFSVSGITEDRIVKVSVDGKKIIKKTSADDLLDGWYFSDLKVFISPSLLGENSVVDILYRVKNTPHANNSTDFAVPESFHDLYVYYVLAQAAAKYADGTSYNNYKNEYNALLVDAVNALTNRQAYPNMVQRG